MMSMILVALEIRSRRHQYPGGAIREKNGIALIINGTADHVHILAKLPLAKVSK